MNQVSSQREIRELHDALRKVSPGYAWLGAHLKVELTDIESGCIDAKGRIQIGSALSADERVLTLIHEVSHAVFNSFERQGQRDRMLWNVAEDFAINVLLYDNHHGLWERARPLSSNILLNEDWRGMSGEEIYEILSMQGTLTFPNGDTKPCENGSGGSNGEEPGNEPGSTVSVQVEIGDDVIEGDVTPVTGPSPWGEASSVVWESAKEIEREAAKAQGHQPAGWARNLDERKAKLPWWEHAYRLLRRKRGGEQTWRRPNKRMMPQGYYLPSYGKNKLRRLVIGFDTSGSMSNGELSKFWAAAKIVAKRLAATRIDWVEIDSAIHNVVQDIDKVEMKGGGGTSFVPFFEWIQHQRVPVDVFFFTDGMGDCPERLPANVGACVWILTPNHKLAPFGTNILTKEDDDV
mgnify:CR=1 FL=1